MQNPILQMLNGNSQMNQMMNKLSQLKSLMSGKNPDDVYNFMLQNNPQFKQFVNDNQGKSVEDIALAYDIDLNLLKQFM